MLDWWGDLDWKLRYGVALLVMLANLIALLGFGILSFWGWGIGIALLLFAGRSDAEKNGYHF
ncbi:MAG: hypothetical protein H6815_13395 [Phycisphaeraceae bacterium]|nr:hypothetical protein [Phycisphaerales bacterium]MCB9861433.1 hypothetical protein [Phycisphaeraceae bacterium]